jgi:hypothetical protein
MAQAKWIRSIINSISRGILGVLLVITVIAFYYSCPWKWLKLSHLAVWLSIVLLWLIVFSVSYKLLAVERKISEKTLAEISAAPPCFVSLGLESPNWQVIKNLFVYGLVGISGLFVFSIGIVGLKHRWVAIMINAVFGLLLFAALAAVFYMHNCDQKSVFISDVQNGFFRYVEGKNYFVDFGMEPYVLTNPGAYPDLAVENVADIHLHQWIESRCPFSPPAGKRSP